VSAEDNNSTTVELEKIQNKKAALHRLIKLTASLSHLSQGLQSVLVLGKSAISIPSKVVENFRLISNKLKLISTQKLHDSLSTAEDQLRADVKHVLELREKTEQELDNYESKEEAQMMQHIGDNFAEYVDDFKKKAQSSIAIRIALTARKAIHSAFQLPIPKAYIKQQIKNLDKKESIYKKRIKKELVGLFNDVSVLIDDPSIAEESKLQLHETRGQLINNINHINAGKKIQDMPMAFESFEVTSNNDEPEAAETEMIVDNMEAIPDLDLDQEVLAEVEEIQIKPIVLIKRNIISRLWEWITTPDDHCWKKISRQIKKH